MKLKLFPNITSSCDIRDHNQKGPLKELRPIQNLYSRKRFPTTPYKYDHLEDLLTYLPIYQNTNFFHN